MKRVTRRRRKRLFACFAAVAALAMAPGPSSAICARLLGDPVFDVAAPGQVVFVGTAVEVGLNRQNALFHVEEVWHGSTIPAWQAVFSQADGRGIWSTSPSFEQGTKYLVVARRHDRGVLVSVSCGGTQPYTQEVGALRPREPSAPTVAGRPGDWEPTIVSGPPWPLFAGGAALLAGVFVVSRSLRRPVVHGTAS